MRRRGVLTVTLPVEVAFHDVDVAAVVWHGHYLKYLENARWALMRRLDFDFPVMQASGYQWPVVQLQMKYVQPARLGERLQVQASLVEWQRRIVINYRILREGDGERVLLGQTVQAAVDAATGALQLVTPQLLQDRIALTLHPEHGAATDINRERGS